MCKSIVWGNHKNGMIKDSNSIFEEINNHFE